MTFATGGAPHAGSRQGSLIFKVYFLFLFFSFLPLLFPLCHACFMGFPGGSAGKESACNAGERSEVKLLSHVQLFATS